MSSVNKVILIGRVGKDAEIKYTASGNPVCRFSVATNETWKDKAGNAEQHTEWHSIQVTCNMNLALFSLETSCFGAAFELRPSKGLTEAQRGVA